MLVVRSEGGGCRGSLEEVTDGNGKKIKPQKNITEKEKRKGP